MIPSIVFKEPCRGSNFSLILRFKHMRHILQSELLMIEMQVKLDTGYYFTFKDNFYLITKPWRKKNKNKQK